MKSYKTVDEYIVNSRNGKDILNVLREVIKSTELIETVKWERPVYTLNGKNIVGLNSFKSYVGLWFFQGALLKDPGNVLVIPLGGTTKALRQWHFKTIEDIDEKLVLRYLNEAIENQKQNREIKPDRNKPLLIPDELEEAFLKDQFLKENFYALTKGKQREFANYISEARRAETRQARLHKIIPMIQQNIGLNDKYRK